MEKNIHCGTGRIKRNLLLYVIAKVIKMVKVSIYITFRFSVTGHLCLDHIPPVLSSQVT